MANDPLDIRKAMATSTLGGTATSAGLFVPEIVSAGIREYFEKRTPVWNQIRKVPVDSQAVVIRSQEGLPTASFGAELAALPAATDTPYAERAVALKSIYTRGELSGQLLAASRSVVNIMEREIRNHTLAMIRRLETALIVGDSAARPAEFDGINTWVSNELNVAGADGADPDTDPDPSPLTLNHLEELLDMPSFGAPNLLIMNAATRRRLWAVLQPQIRFIGETTINGGFSVRAYGDTPILEVAPSTDPAQNLDGVILAVNTDMMYIPVLQDLTYEELAHTRDSTDFIIKMYCGLIVEGGGAGANEGPAYHAKLTGFSTAV